MPFRAPVAALGLVLAVLVMLWPAFYNGQPFFFPDTTTYIRGADAAVQKLTGVATPWTLPQGGEVPHGASSVSSVKDKTVLSGRSIYYGALLYLGDRAGGEWLSVLIQASLLVLALKFTLHAFDLDRWPYLALLVGLLSVFTAAPLYASFLMPDIFAGLTILACTVLLTCNMRGRTAESLFWFVLLAAALTFHTTHVILALTLLAVGAALYFWRRPLVMRWGLGAIVAAVVIAYFCGAAFKFGVTRLVGEPPLTPPFLMARLVDDGPGYRYLVRTCPQNGFVICNFIDRLPMPSDDFLWRQDPSHGVFAASDPAVRRALSKEQYRFALAVMAFDPWGQIKASARNALAQSVLLGVPEFDYTAETKRGFADKVPRSYFDAMKTTRAYADAMPVHLLTAASYISTAAGIGCLAFLLISVRGRHQEGTLRVMQLASLVVLGVIANAAICGIISGPHDRYAARVAWLIPAVALIAHFEIYRAWWLRKFALLSGAK